MDTREDIEREQREARVQVREDAELFEAMIASPAWARYKALIEAVGQNYYNAVMKPLDSTMEVTKSEFAKGVLTGLTLASSIPTLKVREATDLRREASDDDNKETSLCMHLNG